MSVTAAARLLPENTAGPDTPAADTRPEPGLLEQAGAAMRDQFDRARNVQQARKLGAYGELVDALIERGLRRDDLMTRTDVPLLGSQPSGVLDYAKIWREAKRLGIEGLPSTQQDFERQAYSRNGGSARDQAVMARGSGLDATVAQFGGAMIGSFGDPINIVSLPVGGVGRTAAQKIISEGLFNAAIEGHQAMTANPEAWANLGETYELSDAGRDIAIAFTAGMAFRGAGEALPEIDARAYRAAAPVRERFDRFFADRDLARALAEAVPDHLQTPDQAAAARILAREAEIDASSPYARTHAGDAAHRARLKEASEELADVGGARRGPGALNPRILGFLRQRGYSEGQARGIAAGIHAESRSDPGAVNPTSGAFGIGQWLGPRKAELFRRYGNRPTLDQQLEFLDWELRGGDHGGKSVRASFDEADVLRRYIVDFMRPAAGAETTGDLSRGMAALGRAGEVAPEDAPNALAGLGADGLGAADVPVIRPDALDAERPLVSSRAELEDGEPVPRFAAELDEEDPRPLVFHGTNREFDQFEFRPSFRNIDGRPTEVQPQALFFSENRETARMFAKDRQEIDARLRGLERGAARVGAYRLNVERPLDLRVDRETLDFIREQEGWEDYRDFGGPNEYELQSLAWDIYGDPELAPRTWDEVQAMLDDPRAIGVLRDQGYDAVVLREADGSTSWAVFDPEAIARAPAPAEDRSAGGFARDRSPEPGAEQVLALPEPVAKAFDSDAGDGVISSAESDWHDVRAAIEDGRLGDETFDIEEVGLRGTAADIEAEIAAEKAGLEAIRKCLK